MKRAVSLLVLSFFIVGIAVASEVWQPVSGIKESDIKEVIIEEGVIYASSEKRLYRSEDYGETWRVVFSARGDGNIISFISISEQDLFVCTEKGVFRSSDGRSAWKRIFKGIGTEENGAQHIAFSQDGIIYIGTKAGLFLSNDNGATWEKDSGEAGNLSVRWITFHGKDIFLAAEKGVYKGARDRWKRVLVTSMEDVEYDSDTVDTAVIAEKPVNSMMSEQNSLFIATDTGIFVSEDGGDSWKSFPSGGLISQKVNRLLYKDNLFAATDNGIFIFSDKDKAWRALYKGVAGDKANSIASDNKGNIWVATNKGLYRSRFNNNVISVARNDKGSEEENILGQFAHEPSIRDVQEAAIDYAEVHPDKIKKWREDARRKALLPDVSLGLDRYVTDLYHWDAGQNPDVLQTGDDVITWDVTMSWDLGDLIWSTDQTSIDTRSRLMVQLRDDILDEVTRTYFERRRLLIEKHFSPPSTAREKIEKRLRIDELTADLDAMTGGQFSKDLDK
ncbi:MAG: hypothetical protein KKA34_04260 [Candidatus Omnitrophica bacterium]|nr:hypothetical protein [Candidatus Omnitrophota bacterium]